MKKIAIILSGCGFMDGAEIHESVLTLLHVEKQGAQPLFFAPDIPQTTVTNHLTKDASAETRHVLVESARIARGNIQNLTLLTPALADAVILPGGYGAALNLCSFAIQGPDCSVHPEVQRVLEAFYAAQKPIGAICIAPALLAKVLGPKGITLTIGTDSQTAQALEKMGAKHQNQSVEQAWVDKTHKIVSTPAYMLAQNISQAEAGIAKLVHEILELV